MQKSREIEDLAIESSQSGAQISKKNEGKKKKDQNLNAQCVI